MLASCLANEYMNPEWIDPHAWSNDKNPLSHLCPNAVPCQPCEQPAINEYFRLVNTLFDPKKFRVSNGIALFQFILCSQKKQVYFVSNFLFHISRSIKITAR